MTATHPRPSFLPGAAGLACNGKLANGIGGRGRCQRPPRERSRGNLIGQVHPGRRGPVRHGLVQALRRQLPDRIHYDHACVGLAVAKGAVANP